MDTHTPKDILLLCHYYPGCAQTIIDNIQAFKRYSKNNYFILSNLGDLPHWLDLSRFDALVFHYTLIASNNNYISLNGRKRIRTFRGFKAAFVQDDYRWINDTVEAFAYMGIHALFPLTRPDIIDTVYSPKMLPNVRKETVLAGYVPQNLVEIDVKPYKERKLDVGYRARKLPAWIGSHTLQKWQIAERFNSDAAQYGLKVDISCREEDRIYGEDWINFISNCRATLGTESGASVCDFTGNIMRNVEAYLLKYPNEKFEILRSKFFEKEDCKIIMNVISPRCFESAALRTLMILYEGHYSGILVPWRHYVPLKRDHSNMAEVVQILKSVDEAQKIINQAYNEVAKNQNYSYAAMIKLVDRVMDEEWSNLHIKSEHPYFASEFDWLVINNAKNEIINFLELKKSILFDLKTLVPCVSNQPKSNKSVRPTIELSLKKLFLLSSIMIYLPNREGSMHLQFQLRGFAKKKIQFTQEISSRNDKIFQHIIPLPATLPAVDFLEILPIANTVLPWSEKIYLVLLGEEKIKKISYLKIMIYYLKKIIFTICKRVWHILPKRIKAILSPYLHLIKNLFPKLF